MQDSCIQEQERTGWLAIIQLFAPGEAVEPPDLMAGAYFEDGRSATPIEPQAA